MRRRVTCWFPKKMGPKELPVNNLRVSRRKYQQLLTHLPRQKIVLESSMRRLRNERSRAHGTEIHESSSHCGAEPSPRNRLSFLWRVPSLYSSIALLVANMDHFRFWMRWPGRSVEDSPISSFITVLLLDQFASRPVCSVVFALVFAEGFWIWQLTSWWSALLSFVFCGLFLQMSTVA